MTVQLTDVTGQPIPGRIDLDFARVTGDAGVGGVAADVNSTGSVTELTVHGLECRGGPGTLYRVSASTDHYRTYSFFQLIREDRVTTASDDVEFWVKPGDVKGITSPAFGRLPAEARRLLTDATMVRERNEDADLVGLSGEALYDAMGPLRQACFLNIVTKAAHAATTGAIIEEFERLLVCRQDRFFATVKKGLPNRVRKSVLYKSAPDDLHPPLNGYVKSAEGSFKSQDAHANIQVTFQQARATGALAADIDIDESSGIRHGFEVIANAVFRKRTNPYLIREFMASADRLKRSLVPPYGFRF
ncbi:hypothetical protein [Luteitalea sp. TBR-22]|uniref:hypothetical protein n=1 Tax=Luteitalea sp. TBR-22 TaxID=2802971 RepID=UPI001EF4E24F|nr:hypothetical protein [Luteitalea sp. TBR-22]